MKQFKTLMLTTLLLSSVYKSLSQTLTETKIYKYLFSQNESEIISSLQSNGFKFFGIENPDGDFALKVYLKQKGAKVEMVGMGRNDEMFCMTYKPFEEYYPSYKEIMLTPKFKYSYKVEDNRFYDWQGMRIGINDKLKSFSFHITLRR